MDIIKCDKCQGNKTISPLGGISVKCHVCDGIGWIEQDANCEPVQPQELPTNEQPAKSKSRKARYERFKSAKSS